MLESPVQTVNGCLELDVDFLRKNKGNHIMPHLSTPHPFSKFILCMSIILSHNAKQASLLYVSRISSVADDWQECHGDF